MQRALPLWIVSKGFWDVGGVWHVSQEPPKTGLWELALRSFGCDEE
jgi:hypothetical protein